MVVHILTHTAFCRLEPKSASSTNLKKALISPLLILALFFSLHLSAEEYWSIAFPFPSVNECAPEYILTMRSSGPNLNGQQVDVSVVLQYDDPAAGGWQDVAGTLQVIRTGNLGMPDYTWSDPYYSFLANNFPLPSLTTGNYRFKAEAVFVSTGLPYGPGPEYSNVRHIFVPKSPPLTPDDFGISGAQVVNGVYQIESCVVANYPLIFNAAGTDYRNAETTISLANSDCDPIETLYFSEQWELPFEEYFGTINSEYQSIVSSIGSGFLHVRIELEPWCGGDPYVLEICINVKDVPSFKELCIFDNINANPSNPDPWPNEHCIADNDPANPYVLGGASGSVNAEFNNMNYTYYRFELTYLSTVPPTTVPLKVNFGTNQNLPSGTFLRSGFNAMILPEPNTCLNCLYNVPGIYEITIYAGTVNCGEISGSMRFEVTPGASGSQFGKNQFDQGELVHFEFFPNPLQGSRLLNLQVPDAQAHISLSSLSNQKLFEASVKQGRQELRLPDLPAGVYLLHYYDEQGRAAAPQKLIHD